MIEKTPADFTPNPLEDLVYFAYVVDGEVAHMHGIPRIIERAIAALGSDPKVVHVPHELVGDINFSFSDGKFWKYENGEFISPRRNA